MWWRPLQTSALYIIKFEVVLDPPKTNVRVRILVMLFGVHLAEMHHLGAPRRDFR